jgi:hydrogenase nickel incorporation protein HypA/HybF
MHELPVVREVLKIALRYAEQNQGKKIISIHLGVGELRDLVDIWMQKYFEYVSKGTIAEGAILKVKKYPVICQCNECNEFFTLHVHSAQIAVCPVCGKEDFTLVSGKEFLVEGIEII